MRYNLGTYQWEQSTTGFPVTYANWDDHEPDTGTCSHEDQNCVYFDDGTMGDRYCNATYAYVCESNAPDWDAHITDEKYGKLSCKIFLQLKIICIRKLRSSVSTLHLLIAVRIDTFQPRLKNPRIAVL